MNKHMMGVRWLDILQPFLRPARQKDQSGPLVPRIPGPEGNLSVCSKAQTKGLALRRRALVLAKGQERIR